MILAEAKVEPWIFWKGCMDCFSAGENIMNLMKIHGYPFICCFSSIILGSITEFDHRIFTSNLKFHSFLSAAETYQ